MIRDCITWNLREILELARPQAAFRSIEAFFLAAVQYRMNSRIEPIWFEWNILRKYPTSLMSAYRTKRKSIFPGGLVWISQPLSQRPRRSPDDGSSHCRVSRWVASSHDVTWYSADDNIVNISYYDIFYYIHQTYYIKYAYLLYQINIISYYNLIWR